MEFDLEEKWCFGENVNRETERGEKGVVDYKERSEKPGGG
jgi:hypothetical protein